jgi:hypothetical protein
MKPIAPIVLVLLALACPLAFQTLSTEEPKAEEKAAAEKAAKEKPSREELEKKFQEALTDVTLKGKWRLVRGGVLGEEREETYTITSVKKLGDLWFVNARIQYGDKDLTVPVPVKVEWAEGTPVICVTNAGIPGAGTYSARVIIQDTLYAGTWSGVGYGGFLNGTIVKNAK